jgi:hypothetical protein
MLLRCSVGQFSEVVRETEVGRGIRVSPPQALQLAHGPIRDVVQAGAVAEEARQDVEVASSSKPIVVFPVCAPNVPQLTRE